MLVAHRYLKSPHDDFIPPESKNIFDRERDIIYFPHRFDSPITYGLFLQWFLYVFVHAEWGHEVRHLALSVPANDPQYTAAEFVRKVQMTARRGGDQMLESLIIVFDDPITTTQNQTFAIESVGLVRHLLKLRLPSRLAL